MDEQMDAEYRKSATAFAPWEDKATALLKAEMKRCRVSYKQLSRLLESFGIIESAGQINRKVNRKRFSTAYFLACLAAMDVETIAVPSRQRATLPPPER